MESAEGLSPFAGSLRVSLRYKFLHFPHSKGRQSGFETRRPTLRRNANDGKRAEPLVDTAHTTGEIRCPTRS